MKCFFDADFRCGGRAGTGRQSRLTERADGRRPEASSDQDCVERSVCQANHRLTSTYGQLGRVLAKTAT